MAAGYGGVQFGGEITHGFGIAGKIGLGYFFGGWRAEMPHAKKPSLGAAEPQPN
jgi:hypothetical protein